MAVKLLHDRIERVEKRYLKVSIIRYTYLKEYGQGYDCTRREFFIRTSRDRIGRLMDRARRRLPGIHSHIRVIRAVSISNVASATHGLLAYFDARGVHIE